VSLSDFIDWHEPDASYPVEWRVLWWLLRTLICGLVGHRAVDLSEGKCRPTAFVCSRCKSVGTVRLRVVRDDHEKSDDEW